VQVLEHVYPNVVVLELTGQLTVESEADLRDAVRRHLDAGRLHLVLDLARVPYVDSCGLGTMVQAYVSAHRAGGSAKLMNITPRVRHLLSVTRLLTVFELYRPDLSEERRTKNEERRAENEERRAENTTR
jgi:anti-sigma B factor antagonist